MFLLVQFLSRYTFECFVQSEKMADWYINGKGGKPHKKSRNDRESDKINIEKLSKTAIDGFTKRQFRDKKNIFIFSVIGSHNGVWFCR